MNKISIRFFDDKEVRAVWDDEDSKWWFSVVDIVDVLSQSADSRNYWYVLKNRLKKAGSEVLTSCKGFKLMANGIGIYIRKTTGRYTWKKLCTKNWYRMSTGK